MKKLSLLFACIGLFTFAANAQEPVKAKQTKEPVKVAPVEKPMKVEKVEAPAATNDYTTATTPSSQPVKSPRKRAKIPTKANATATPIVRAGEAK